MAKHRCGRACDIGAVCDVVNDSFSERLPGTRRSSRTKSRRGGRRDPHIPRFWFRCRRRAVFIRAHYLDTIETLNLARPGARAAVIGGGQSAAEVTVDFA